MTTRFDFNNAVLNEGFDFNELELTDPSEINIENHILSPLHKKILDSTGTKEIPGFYSYGAPDTALPESELYYVYIKNLDSLITTPDPNIVKRLKSKNILDNKTLNGGPSIDYFMFGDMHLKGDSRIAVDNGPGQFVRQFPTVNFGKAPVVFNVLIEHCIPGYFEKTVYPPVVPTHYRVYVSDDSSVLYNIHWTCMKNDYNSKAKALLPPMILLYNPGNLIIKNFKIMKKLDYHVTTINEIPVSELFWP